MTENRWIYKVSLRRCWPSCVLNSCARRLFLLPAPPSSSGGAADEAQKERSCRTKSKDRGATPAATPSLSGGPCLPPLRRWPISSTPTWTTWELPSWTRPFSWSGSAWTLPSPPHWVARYAAKESYGVADFFYLPALRTRKTESALSAADRRPAGAEGTLKIWTYSAPMTSPSPQVTQAGDYMYLCMLPHQRQSWSRFRPFWQPRADFH